jgi:hypothetical protein
MNDWVIFYVMTIVECYAPPGKTVCERQAPIKMPFVSSVDCTVALDVWVQSRIRASNVILVDTPKCEATPYLVANLDPGNAPTEGEFAEARDNWLQLRAFQTFESAKGDLGEELFDDYVSVYWDEYQQGRP